MGGVSEAVNPYAAPAARVDDFGPNAEAEAIRRAHVNHEAAIKSVGVLYYLGGAVATLVGAGSLIGAASGAQGAAIMALVLLPLGAGQFFAGYGVRALRPWGRILGCVISAVGLLGFPIGTVISAYILYLFLSKKGRTIFAPGYQDVIAATPHVKYRTSIVVWIFLAVLAVLVVLAVAAAYFGR